MRIVFWFALSLLSLIASEETNSFKTALEKYAMLEKANLETLLKYRDLKDAFDLLDMAINANLFYFKRTFLADK